jgi:hypothetical protein
MSVLILLAIISASAIIYFFEGWSDAQVTLDHQLLRKYLDRYGRPSELLETDKRNGVWHNSKMIPYAALHTLAFFAQLWIVPIPQSACLTLVGLIVGRIIIHPISTAIHRGIPINTMSTCDSCDLSVVGWRFWLWGWDWWDALTIQTCTAFNVGQFTFYGALLTIPVAGCFLFH